MAVLIKINLKDSEVSNPTKYVSNSRHRARKVVLYCLDRKRYKERKPDSTLPRPLTNKGPVSPATRKSGKYFRKVASSIPKVRSQNPKANFNIAPFSFF